MDYKKETKQQLLTICYDPFARLRDRYAAAKELEKRRGGHAEEARKSDVQISEVRTDRRSKLGASRFMRDPSELD